MFAPIQQLFEHPAFLPAVTALLVGLLIGSLISRLRAQKEIEQLRVDNARLDTLLEADQAHFAEQMEHMQEARTALSQEFAQLSQRALKQNNGLFLRLAEQSLKMQSARATAELEKKEQSIEHLLTPIREQLRHTGDKLTELEKQREHAFGALTQQLHQLAGSELDLRNETRNLVNALRRPDIRGRWGEMSLKRIAELSGMVEHCDFYEQVSGNDRLRPDMVVQLPEHRAIVVDAKSPLDGFLGALDAGTPEEEQAALQQHAKQLNDRVTELARKAYWQQFDQSPAFVVLFVPGDQFLAAALQQQPALLERAMAQNIVLATPSTLMALLRAVEFGWRQNQFTENAEEIRQLAESVQHRLGVFTEHLAQLGKSLDNSVAHYNKAVGSLHRQVMPASQKMEQLGIQGRKRPQTPDDVERATRPQPERSDERPTST